jgi:hypothetical protein
LHQPQLRSPAMLLALPLALMQALVLVSASLLLPAPPAMSPYAQGS